MAKRTKKEIEKSENIFQRILNGKLVSYRFFTRNWVYITIFVGIFIVYISSRYRVQTQLAEIMKLEMDLNNAETEKVKASAIYNSSIREPEMRRLIDSMKLELAMPERPPYDLRK